MLNRTLRRYASLAGGRFAPPWLRLGAWIDASTCELNPHRLARLAWLYALPFGQARALRIGALLHVTPVGIPWRQLFAGSATKRGMISVYVINSAQPSDDTIERKYDGPGASLGAYQRT